MDYQTFNYETQALVREIRGKHKLLEGLIKQLKHLDDRVIEVRMRLLRASDENRIETPFSASLQLQLSVYVGVRHHYDLLADGVEDQLQSLLGELAHCNRRYRQLLDNAASRRSMEEHFAANGDLGVIVVNRVTGSIYREQRPQIRSTRDVIPPMQQPSTHWRIQGSSVSRVTSSTNDLLELESGGRSEESRAVTSSESAAEETDTASEEEEDADDVTSAPRVRGHGIFVAAHESDFEDSESDEDSDVADVFAFGPKWRDGAE